MARYRPPTPPPVDDPSTPNVDESTLGTAVDQYAPRDGVTFLCRVCGFAHTPERWLEKWNETPDSVEFVPCDQCGRTPVTAAGDPKYVWPAELPKEAPVLKREWEPDLMICNVCGTKHVPAVWAALLAARPVGDTTPPACPHCGSQDVMPATAPAVPVA